MEAHVSPINYNGFMMTFPFDLSPICIYRKTPSTQGGLIWLLQNESVPNRKLENSPLDSQGTKHMCFFKEEVMVLYMKSTLNLPPPTHISNPFLNLKKYPERKQYNPTQAVQASAIEQKSCEQHPVSSLVKPQGNEAARCSREEAAMFINLLSTTFRSCI